MCVVIYLHDGVNYLYFVLIQISVICDAVIIYVITNCVHQVL